MTDVREREVLREMRRNEHESAGLALSHAKNSAADARAALASGQAGVKQLELAINEQRNAPAPADESEAQHIDDCLRALEAELVAARDAVNDIQVALHEAERVVSEYADDLRECEAALRALE
jgi:flagellar biosynthesis chaperone FliJ